MKNCLFSLQCDISSLPTAIVYKNFIFPQEYALEEDAAFLHFCLKENSENMIFPRKGNIRKLMKIWSLLSFSQIFVRRNFFFHAVLTLKQRWFWVDIKTNFVLLYQQTQHVTSMLKLRRHVNIDKFSRHSDVLFWIIGVILMYIFDIISMDVK